MAAATAVGIAALYVFLASRSTLWDRDEPRFARATVEMLEAAPTQGFRSFLVPTFEGEVRAHKPILLYWLMAGSVGLFGPHELAFRLPSCLAAAGTCLLTFAVGLRLVGRRSAWWAMAMVGLSPLMLVEGTLATADAVLVFFLTAAMAVFVHGLTSRFGWGHVLGLGLTLGLAQLTKGPVALLLALSMVVSWWLLPPPDRTPHRRRFWWCLAGGVVLSAVLFLAWFLPANALSANRLWDEGVGRHLLQRSVSPMEGHGGTRWWHYPLLLPAYLGVVVAFFFPWTLHLPGAVRGLIGGRLSDRRTSAVLIGWIAPTFVVMSLVATKLPHYILPLWPALALIAARGIEQHDRGVLDAEDRRWLRGGVWFFLPIAAALVAAALAIPWAFALATEGEADARGLLGAPWWPALGLAGVTAAWSWLAVRWQLWEQARATARLSVLAMVLLPVACALVWLPPLERSCKLSPAVARIMAEAAAPGTPWTRCGYAEPSLTFYAGRGAPQSLPAPELAAWARQASPALLVVTRKALTQATQEHGPLPLAAVGAVHGINLNDHLRPVGILVLRRGQDAWGGAGQGDRP